jgi:uncharacterized membrane protein
MSFFLFYVGLQDRSATAASVFFKINMFVNIVLKAFLLRTKPEATKIFNVLIVMFLVLLYLVMAQKGTGVSSAMGMVMIFGSALCEGIGCVLLEHVSKNKQQDAVQHCARDPRTRPPCGDSDDSTSAGKLRALTMTNVWKIPLMFATFWFSDMEAVESEGIENCLTPIFFLGAVGSSVLYCGLSFAVIATAGAFQNSLVLTLEIPIAYVTEMLYHNRGVEAGEAILIALLTVAVAQTNMVMKRIDDAAASATKQTLEQVADVVGSAISPRSPGSSETRGSRVAGPSQLQLHRPTW